MVEQDREQASKGRAAPQVAALCDMIDYQADSVVSREIIKGKTGTVTLFAFDRGQGLSEHKAPFDALVYLVDGEAQITISSEPYRLTRGETMVMPANEPHALDAVQKFKMLLVMIRS